MIGFSTSGLLVWTALAGLLRFGSSPVRGGDAGVGVVDEQGREVAAFLGGPLVGDLEECLSVLAAESVAQSAPGVGQFDDCPPPVELRCLPNQQAILDHPGDHAAGLRRVDTHLVGDIPDGYLTICFIDDVDDLIAHQILTGDRRIDVEERCPPPQSGERGTDLVEYRVGIRSRGGTHNK